MTEEDRSAFPLEYCPLGRETVARLRRLFEERDQSIVCASMTWPSTVLREFARTHAAGFCEYPDPEERIRFWDAYWHERALAHDDHVPSAYLSEMDQGLYGGMVGGDVDFMCDTNTGWISSMVHPILDDWSGLEGLRVDTECMWFQRYLSQLRTFVRNAGGKFGVSHFILINGLNFVFELFGATRTYVELTESPEMIKKALDFAFDLNLCVQRTFFQEAPLIEGGTCSDMVMWIPGSIISESVDPFHMTSVDCFERWGRPTLERIFGEFDGGVTHIHGNGRHLLEAVSAVKGLKGICLGDDRGYPLAFDVLGEIQQKTRDMPLIVSTTYEQFTHALKDGELLGGVLYHVDGAEGPEEASRCMARVRSYCP